LSDKRKYRRFNAQQKAELVLASSRGERSIAELCREHDISEILLRRWRDQMVEAGMERSQAGQDRSLAAEQRRRIAQLERTLGRKTYEPGDAEEAGPAPAIQPAAALDEPPLADDPQHALAVDRAPQLARHERCDHAIAVGLFTSATATGGASTSPAGWPARLAAGGRVFGVR
jgi:transposase